MARTTPLIPLTTTVTQTPIQGPTLPSVALAQFHETMQQFLDTQQAVMTAFLSRGSAAPIGAPSALPEVPDERRSPVSVRGHLPALDPPRDGDASAAPQWTGDRRLTASLVLGPATDWYLQDHVLDGKPVLPTAMAQEMLSELVAYGWPQWTIRRLKGLQVLKGVIFQSPCERIQLTAELVEANESGALIRTELVSEALAPRVSFRLDVEVGGAADTRPAPRVAELANMESFPLGVGEAYHRWLFHGPLLANIVSIDGIGQNGMEAVLRPSAPADLLAGQPTGEWLVDPVVFDCALQMSLLWQRYRWDSTGLPARYTCVHRLASLGDGDIRCRLVLAPDATATLFRADFAFWNAAGELAWYVERMECTASKALNRLVGQRQD